MVRGSGGSSGSVRGSSSGPGRELGSGAARRALHADQVAVGPSAARPGAPHRAVRPFVVPSDTARRSAQDLAQSPHVSGALHPSGGSSGRHAPALERARVRPTNSGRARLAWPSHRACAGQVGPAGGGACAPPPLNSMAARRRPSPCRVPFRCWITRRTPPVCPRGRPAATPPRAHPTAAQRAPRATTGTCAASGPHAWTCSARMCGSYLRTSSGTPGSGMVRASRSADGSPGAWLSHPRARGGPLAGRGS